MCVYMHVCMYISIMYICMYVCMYVCMLRVALHSSIKSYCNSFIHSCIHCELVAKQMLSNACQVCELAQGEQEPETQVQENRERQLRSGLSISFVCFVLLFCLFSAHC